MFQLSLMFVFFLASNPNLGPNTVEHEWESYNEDSRYYLTQTPTMATEQESEDLLRRYTFWAEEFMDHVIFKEDLGTADSTRLFESGETQCYELLSKC